jgi:hypothetical protein
VENTAGLNVMAPALARLPDGSLAMTYSHRESEESAWRVFVRSTDEGQTWGDEVIVAPGGYITGCHDRLTVLGSGRIICPLHLTESWYDHYLCTRVAWSDDNGRSWRLGDPVSLPRIDGAGESGAWEPGVVERADGTLLLVLRTGTGTLYRAVSSDGGETWGGLCSLEVVSPVAPGKITRIPGSDDLLLLWNWNFSVAEPMMGYRTPLACAVSRDGGESWPRELRKILVARPGYTYAYPSCVFAGDRAYVTFYEAAKAEPFGRRSLCLVRLERDWIYAPAGPDDRPGGNGGGEGAAGWNG